MVFSVIAVAGVIASGAVPWWAMAFMAAFVISGASSPGFISAGPDLLPLTGPLVTLYDDRIVRQSAKSRANITLDNISRCDVRAQDDGSGRCVVLTFTAKRRGLGALLLRLLTETAIEDASTAEQVIAFLREKGVAVTRTA